ncbi:MAG: response regulator [Patescibacteria group bacterium]
MENINDSIILIIEDDKFLRELIVQKLVAEGFKVYSAIDGEESFKILEKIMPHLILLDLILPGMDGFEILTRLKKDQKTSSVPILVLSNLGQKEDIDKAVSLGAVGYMIKANFTPGEIVEKVKNILREKYL